MKSPLIVTSVGFHLVVVAGFFVAGMWKLEKLDSERRPIDIAVAPQPTPAASGSPAASPATPFTKKPPKVQVKVPVQPTVIDTTVKPAATTALDTGGTGGTGSGAGSGSGYTPTGTGDCVGDHCGDPEPKKPEPKVVETKKDPVFVPPSVLKAIRTSGDTQIQPPPNVRTAISRDGKSKVTATFKICLSADGEVTSTTQLTPSGYEGYDRALAEGIRTWRYRPYEIGGKRTAVCSAVTFIYVMK